MLPELTNTKTTHEGSASLVLMREFPATLTGRYLCCFPIQKMTIASSSSLQSSASVAGYLPDEDRLAWLGLTLSPGLGPRRILDAMRQLDAPSQVFGMPLTAIEGLRFPAAAAQFVFDGKARAAADQEWTRAQEQGVRSTALPDSHVSPHSSGD